MTQHNNTNKHITHQTEPSTFHLHEISQIQKFRKFYHHSNSKQTQTNKILWLQNKHPPMKKSKQLTTTQFQNYPKKDYLVNWCEENDFDWQIEQDIFICKRIK